MVDIFLEICSIENRGVAQSGSALRSGRRGRWFESSHPDIFKKLSVLLGAFFMGLRPHKSPRTEVLGYDWEKVVKRFALVFVSGLKPARRLCRLWSGWRAPRWPQD